MDRCARRRCRCMAPPTSTSWPGPPSPRPTPIAAFSPYTMCRQFARLHQLLQRPVLYAAVVEGWVAEGRRRTRWASKSWPTTWPCPPALKVGLWIAWFSAHQETVNVLRTNEADSKFGPVRTYPTPCTGYGVLGPPAGNFNVLTWRCSAPPRPRLWPSWSPRPYPPLSLQFTKTLANTSAHTLHFEVTDVGDPVPGATVRPGK